MWLALSLAVVRASLATTPAVPEQAEGAEASETAAPEVVLRVDAAAGLSDAAVADALEAHLAELDQRVRVERDATEARPRVELSRLATGAVQVDVWVEGADTPWSREIPDDGDPDLLLESIGVVVRGMLVAGVPEPEPEPKPATVPPRPVEPELPPPSQLDAAIAYYGETVAADLPWQSGIGAHLTWQAPRGLLVDGGVAWMPSHRIRTGAGAGLGIQRVHATVGAGFRFRRQRRVRPAVLASVGAEVLGWSGAATQTQEQPGFAARVAAGVAGELQVDVGAGFFAIARIGADAWLVGADLVASSAGGERRLLQTSIVSGQAALGVGYRFFFIRNRRRGATGKVGE